MGAHRYQATFRNITFNAHLDNSGIVDDSDHLVQAKINDDYYLDSLDLTRVTVEDFREMRQFLEGAEANEAIEGVLIATLRGHIAAASPGLLEDMTWAMREAFSPAAVRIAAASATPKGVLPFDFKVDTAEAGGVPQPSARRLYCRPAIGRPIIVGRVREGLVRRYLAQLISFDPRVVSQTLTQQVISGATVCANAGLALTYPTIYITFSGAGDAALTLTHTTTGKAFVINATTAAAGEVWVLDTYAGTMVRQSDGANRYSQRVSGYLSDLFLLAGSNTITPSNVGGVSQLRYDFRAAWA